MNTLPLELATVYAHLTSFAALESFWASFNTALSSEYNLAKAKNIRIQRLKERFSYSSSELVLSFPKVFFAVAFPSR